MKWLIIFTICITSIILLFDSGSAGPYELVPGRRMYGESCNKNKTLRCDSKSWLKCIDDKCDCFRPFEMQYVSDAESSKCVSNVRMSCRFPVNEEENDSLRIFENSACVENAECDSSGICVCSTGSFEDFDFTIFEHPRLQCSPKSKFNETCMIDFQCEDNMGLTCINGVCICDSSNIFDARTSSCAGKAGSRLSNSRACISGSTNNSAGICTCNPEGLYYAGNDGKCVYRKARGEACTRDAECKLEHTFLKCMKGFCDCPRDMVYRRTNISVLHEKPYQEYWDKSYPKKNTKLTHIEQCVGLVDMECNPDRNCVENAECDESTRICNCRISYSATAGGTCGHGLAYYEMVCSETKECIRPFVCRNGECRCQNPLVQKYDSKSHTCLMEVPGGCTKDSDCVSNAVCLSKPGSTRMHCQCKAGFIENSLGICDLAFGSTCSYMAKNSKHYNQNSYNKPKNVDLPCDRVAGLECINQKCSCSHSYEAFYPELRKCLSLAGSVCFTNASQHQHGFTDSCVENATCQKNHPELRGTCECLDGFMENEDLLCVTKSYVFG